ncbi:unnamed protein product [Protopolystoma xenopodis]|uniref:Uncharacterized protein n=1 Tax=Protopolystoma xenopodis TaxID=117903 RepID=A0A448XA23_9PLAT|nr:unnamed protein product [Protopolystoma xenopodis]
MEQQSCVHKPESRFTVAHFVSSSAYLGPTPDWGLVSSAGERPADLCRRPNFIMCVRRFGMMQAAAY